MKGDPYWITAKYPGTCAKCQVKINKGERIFYYPNGNATYGDVCGCGDTAARDFFSAAADEDLMGG